jgi:hypothetical protein
MPIHRQSIIYNAVQSNCVFQTRKGLASVQASQWFVFLEIDIFWDADLDPRDMSVGPEMHLQI